MLLPRHSLDITEGDHLKWRLSFCHQGRLMTVLEMGTQGANEDSRSEGENMSPTF